MSFQVNLPPSVVAKQAKSEEEDEPKKQSREEWKKMKELEEARKAGTVPAMQDEEGKDINPHIPQYIMQAPWYFGAIKPTLQHQRPQPEKQKVFARLDEWYKRGIKEGSQATKYRKGACENCGAMTHKKKDCLERPRRVGAKYTGERIASDEYILPQLSLDYDGKRDIWNGYDPEDHQRKLFSEYSKILEAKQMIKEHKDQDAATPATAIADKEDASQQMKQGSDDEDKYADDLDMPGQKFETKQRITVRNLRIREDTAKYLYNLDPNSAFYDPKTRSMRENPYKNSGKDSEELKYAGDNFVRFSGDAHNMAKKQMFAWEAYERGAEVHLQADPTKLELLHSEYRNRKENFKTSQRAGILDKYGGEKYLETAPKQLLLAQTEDYVEYSRHGTVIKGQEKASVKSRYEEDVYINNHTSVWGSYWKGGRWGYKCCFNFMKESYCTGEAGKQTAESNDLIPDEEASLTELPTTLLQQHEQKLKDSKKKKKKKGKKKHKKNSISDESSDSESEIKKKQEKLRKALEMEEEDQKRAERLLQMDERKRPYNSMYEAKAPTEEQMEAYQMKRMRVEDPMATFLSKS